MISDADKKAGNALKRSAKRVYMRMYFIAIACFFAFTVVAGRAVYLHLVDNKDLKWIADKQYNAKIPMSIRRGKIFDRNGSELAVSLPVPSVYADPPFVENPEQAAKMLAPVLKENEKALLEKLKTPRRFVWLKRRVSYDTLNELLALNLQGVHYIEESRRFYPNGELASQVLGAVGLDSQALAGLELKYDDILKSQKKASSFKRDARGRMYSTPVSFGEQSDVGDVYLTIDKQIQFIAENELRMAVAEHNAKDGVAVVIDPLSGDVLAMANAPVFDPNRYSKFPVSNWKNRVVTDAFEPGSTFKVLVVAAALNAGIANPEKNYDCENGAYRIGSNVLKDHHPYGKLSVQDIIKFSSNIGAMKVGFDLGKKDLYETLKGFGIGDLANVGFPGEEDGVLRNYEGWQKIEQATIAFGQGLTVTPLQMAAAFAAVVNGGEYRRPRLVSRIIDRDGNLMIGPKSEVVSHPINKETSDVMRLMLRRVVEQGGTGTRANSEAYTIGGKTGTAQKVDGGKGYAHGKYFASFIGFATVEDPKLVVFVGLDEPKGSYYGGSVAAPAVKNIIDQSLSYMGVPSAKSPVMYTASHSMGMVENNVNFEEASRRPELIRVGNDEYSMPDLKGLTMRDVLMFGAEGDVEAHTQGTGVAIAQAPLPGVSIKKGEKFFVKFESPR